MARALHLATWQAKQRPLVGHRSGKARCRVVLQAVFSVDGKTAFYSCPVCEWRDERRYPAPRQLELELRPPATGQNMAAPVAPAIAEQPKRDARAAPLALLKAAEELQEGGR